MCSSLNEKVIQTEANAFQTTASKKQYITSVASAVQDFEVKKSNVQRKGKDATSTTALGPLDAIPEMEIENMRLEMDLFAVLANTCPPNSLTRGVIDEDISLPSLNLRKRYIRILKRICRRRSSI